MNSMHCVSERAVSCERFANDIALDNGALANVARCQRTSNKDAVLTVAGYDVGQDASRIGQ
ncbi:MAG: hypothetical protein AAGG44_15915, partial [Planctomycetota bacterium]